MKTKNEFRTWINLAFYILVEDWFIRASPLRASGHLFAQVTLQYGELVTVTLKLPVMVEG